MSKQRAERPFRIVMYFVSQRLTLNLRPNSEKYREGQNLARCYNGSLCKSNKAPVPFDKSIKAKKKKKKKKLSLPNFRRHLSSVFFFFFFFFFCFFCCFFFFCIFFVFNKLLLGRKFLCKVERLNVKQRRSR